MAIEAIGLRKVFPEFRVEVDLKVESDEILVVAGPSGCGKTTALQMIAGILPHDGGTVLIDGEDVGGLPPWKRRIGVVFQDLGLFPHLSVAGNIEYGPSVAGVPKNERTAAVEFYLEALRLSGYGRRRIDTLSGGERQRIAIARALAAKPQALLMDEPFSSLDAPLRRELRSEFRALRQKEGFPCLFVTHDRDEAAALGDRIAVMRGGRVIEEGTPERLFGSPKSAFVASFLGAGTVVPEQEALRTFEGAIPRSLADELRTIGNEPKKALLIPRDGLRIRPQGPENEAGLNATVVETLLEGDRTVVVAEAAGGLRLTLSQNRREAIPRTGEPIRLAVNPEFLRVVADDL